MTLTRSFFNLLWLPANDFIVGAALAMYVRDNAAPIRSLVSELVEVRDLSLTSALEPD